VLHDRHDHPVALLDQVLDLDPELVPGLVPGLDHPGEPLRTVVRARVRHAVGDHEDDVVGHQRQHALEVAAVVRLDGPCGDVQLRARHSVKYHPDP
jgi:hypothetical protein